MKRLTAALGAILTTTTLAFGQAPQTVRLCSGNPCVAVSSTNPLPTGAGGAASAGTPYHLPGGSAATTNSTLIATGPRTLYSVTVINLNATVYYLRLYDLAVAPTASSATGATHSYPIPASTTGAGIQIPFGPGEGYINGLGFVITGGGADTDATVAATGVYVN